MNGAAESPPASSSRRLGLVLAALLAFLVGAGGYLALRDRGEKTVDREDPSKSGNTGGERKQLPPCSDDADPKEFETLSFGPPVAVRYDRQFFDALADKPIPVIEKYPWQPEGLVAVLGEHRMRGQAVAVSRDGKTLAVGQGSYIRFGSIDTLHENLVLPCPGGVSGMTESPDGATLAVLCGDGNFRLFDIRNLNEMPPPVVLERAEGSVGSFAWSGDGKYLIGGDMTPKRGIAFVWEVSSRKVVQRLKHIGPVMGVAFSPVPGDYRALTAGGVEDGQLHLWDVVAGAKKAAIDFRSTTTKVDVTTTVGPVGFSPDGKRAFSSHPEGVVRLWDLERFEKGKEVHSLGGHAANVAPLAAFSPDGKRMITSRLADGGVWLWNLEDGKKVRQLGTSAGVYTLRFLPGGERIVFSGTVSGDHNVHLHEVETGKEILPPVGHLSALTSVTVAPAGHALASGASDHSIRIWDVEAVKQKHAVGAGTVGGMGYHPDGKRLYYFGGSYATLGLLDADSGQGRTPAYNTSHSGPIVSAAITRDGRYAVTGGSDGTVRMWQLADGRQVRRFDFESGAGVAIVTVAPDMRRAIRVGGNSTRLLHLRCRQEKHTWPAVGAAPFLPDGRAVFLGGANAPLWTITADRVEESGRYDLNLAGLGPSHLSADGKRVAAVVGGRVAVYELESGKELWKWEPPAHFGGVSNVAMTPDGRHLVTANGDGTVYVVRVQ